MAFQVGAFQGDAFQTEIPVPPEPPAPSPGGISAVAETEIRRFGTVRVRIRVSGTGRIHLDEEDLRRRVRDYLTSLLG